MPYALLSLGLLSLAVGVVLLATSGGLAGTMIAIFAGVAAMAGAAMWLDFLKPTHTLVVSSACGATKKWRGTDEGIAAAHALIIGALQWAEHTP